MTTALITGASSGIGLELAKLMAAKQHNLVLVARSAGKLNDLKAELEKTHGIEVLVLPADLTKNSAPQQIFDAVANRQIDILINNAGFGDFELFKDAELSKQIDMIQLNITALTELTHLFLQGMVSRQSGWIMNVASTAAFQPGPWMAVYYATKAFVLSFSDAIGFELKESGVTVTALCPGATETGFADAADAGGSKLFNTRDLPDAEKVAAYAYSAMMKGKRIAVHGTLNKMMAQSVRFTPRAIVLRFVDKVAGKKGQSL